MRFLYVMDPLGGIDITKDTTFAFLRESQKRGHESHFCEITDLAFVGDGLQVRTAPVTVREVQGEHYELGEYAWRAAEEFECIFMRKDPPFDTDFYFSTQMLSLVDETKTFVFNRGSGLRDANEKMFILKFPELTAETIVSSRADTILGFRDRVGGDIVVKPLDGCGGAGIFRITHDDLNTKSILEMSTAEGTRLIMAQRYLPESRDGDTRLLYLDGRPLGAVKRVPAGDDLRGNLHVGGTAAAAGIGELEHRICETLEPHLSARGIWFAGLDVIGGYLTEVNVTSPTGIQESGELAGKNLEAEVIDFVEGRCRTLQR